MSQSSVLLCPAAAALCVALALIACGEERKPPLGGGGDSDDTGSPVASCPDAWEEQEDGSWLSVDPCLYWSPRGAEELSWYQAASASDAAAGGCASCDDGEEQYCEDLGLGGRLWRLPSQEELLAVALDSPPLEPLEGSLWSRDADTSMGQLAWQVDLSRPSEAMLAGMSQPAWVRCVSETAQ